MVTSAAWWERQSDKLASSAGEQSWVRGCGALGRCPLLGLLPRSRGFSELTGTVTPTSPSSFTSWPTPSATPSQEKAVLLNSHHLQLLPCAGVCLLQIYSCGRGPGEFT